jgi:hypothetical protein
MSRVDLYGFEHESIDVARASVERALGIELVEHESSYLGDYFRGGGDATEDMILQRNYHPAVRQWVEPAHRNVPYLLYVNNPASPETVRARLEAEPGVRRLRYTPTRVDAGRFSESAAGLTVASGEDIGRA